MYVHDANVLWKTDVFGRNTQHPAVVGLLVIRIPIFVSFQDAQEFYLHLLSVLEREDKVRNRPSCITPLQFAVEDRIQCSVTSKVRHLKTSVFYLKVQIFEKLTNALALLRIESNAQSPQRYDTKKLVCFTRKFKTLAKLTDALFLLRIKSNDRYSQRYACKNRFITSTVTTKWMLWGNVFYYM